MSNDSTGGMFLQALKSLFIAAIRVVGFVVAWCIKVCGLVLVKAGDELLKICGK